MVARNEGMTKTYNRFHEPTETAEDIQRLRELHAAMDRAVLEAYGWHDLAARAAPIFLDETNEDDHTYRAACSGPPTSATKSSPASSRSTPNATPRSPPRHRPGDEGEGRGGRGRCRRRG